MIKSVLYTIDMDPITIIELPLEVHQFKFDYYRVPIYPPADLTPCYENVSLINNYYHVVGITVERFRYYKRYTGEEIIKPLFIVSDCDKELVYLMEPAYLDGQISDVKRREREEFFAGFVSGMKRVMG